MLITHQLLGPSGGTKMFEVFKQMSVYFLIITFICQEPSTKQ